MNKRKFLKTSAGVGIISLMTPSTLLQANSLIEENYHPLSSNRATAFKAASLTYGTNALEPYIDTQTMIIHHDKHYQGYTDKLNAAIQRTQYAQMSIEEILKKVGENDTAVRNNGGGYYNHTMFWKWIAPSAEKQPSGKLADAINSIFGSFAAFKEEFSGTATSVFGSGWAWLLTNKNGKLSLASTPNQDNPMMSFTAAKGTPILGIDVWEHAYYLKYQNKRADYIDAFFQVINWEEVASLYSAI